MKALSPAERRKYGNFFYVNKRDDQACENHDASVLPSSFSAAAMQPQINVNLGDFDYNPTLGLDLTEESRILT